MSNPEPSAPRETPKTGAKRPGRPDQWPRWALWSALGLLVLVLLAVGIPGGDQGVELSYSAFRDRVSNGLVDKVEVDTESHHITGTLSNGSHFTTSGPVDI